MKVEAYKPPEGMTWNPLLKYPRNELCFCGETTRKAKFCCLPKMKPFCHTEQVEFLQSILDLAKERRKNG